MSKPRNTIGRFVCSPVLPKPPNGVVVFVHGQSEAMSDYWKEENDALIRYVTESGFDTCFANLDPNGSVAFNASSLSEQLQQIVRLYDTKRVTIVAHGKGGIDTEGAIHYHKADRYIERVITLGTPFWGSPLADNLYNERSCLRIPHLRKSDAEYDLQTSRMLSFRKEYDTSDAKRVPFYTIAGNKASSDTEAAVTYFLNDLGPNDGVVLVKSTRRPFCITTPVLPLDHDALSDGERVWSVLEPHLFTRSLSTQPVISTTYNGSVSSRETRGAVERTLKQMHEREMTFVFLEILLFLCVVLFVVFIHIHRPMI